MFFYFSLLFFYSFLSSKVTGFPTTVRVDILKAFTVCFTRHSSAFSILLNTFECKVRVSDLRRSSCCLNTGSFQTIPLVNICFIPRIDSPAPVGLRSPQASQRKWHERPLLCADDWGGLWLVNPGEQIELHFSSRWLILHSSCSETHTHTHTSMRVC